MRPTYSSVWSLKTEQHGCDGQNWWGQLPADVLVAWWWVCGATLPQTTSRFQSSKNLYPSKALDIYEQSKTRPSQAIKNITYVCVSICLYVYKDVCIDVYIHIYIYMYIYIYICTWAIEDGGEVGDRWLTGYVCVCVQIRVTTCCDFFFFVEIAGRDEKSNFWYICEE